MKVCGIVGFIEGSSFVPSEGPSPYERLAAMSHEVQHRVPDDWGMCFLGFEREFDPSKQILWRPGDRVRIALGHRRLSIIDLSENGRQPMWNPEGTVAIIFNGEIYNHVELREELRNHWRFRTSSGTEVLLAAYERWGVEMLPLLDGIFGIALWDGDLGRLLLARDPMGVKPLYFSASTGRFLFGSEPRAVLAGLGTRGHADPIRLAEFLIFGITDHDGGTCYEEVFQLPEGHRMEVTLDAVSSIPDPFWKPPVSEQFPSDDHVPDLLRAAIDQAVSRHLRSHAPLGSCLSGGLDSSALVMTASQLLGRKTGDYTTLTIVNPGFPEDESEAAQATAQAAGMKWVPVHADISTLADDLERMAAAMGEPYSTLSMFAHYKVMERAGSLGLKVMLDAQGGDEVYLGYPRLAQRILPEYLGQGRFFKALSEWIDLKRNASLPLWSTVAGNLFLEVQP